MTVDVSRVGPAAAADVHAVIGGAFSARPTLDPPADALSETVHSIASELRAHPGVLATLDGRPVGALLLRPKGDAMLLRRFGVIPAAQGHGVARALVTEALACTVGYASLAVLAREELPATVAFWERHGFVVAQHRSPFVELRRPLPTSWQAVDADEMRALGERLGHSVHAGDVVVLTGELGAGKTTLTQGLGIGLRVRGAVTSPTFVISRVHPSLVGGPDLVHVDAYRLGGIDELDDLDLDTSLSEAVTVVEWGAGLAERLADSRLEVTISRALGDAAPEDGADPRVVRARRVGAG